MQLVNILGKKKRNKKKMDKNSGQTHNVGHQIPTHIYLYTYINISGYNICRDYCVHSKTAAQNVLL